MSASRHLRVVDGVEAQIRLTGDHWWDPDRDRHVRDSPRYCISCGGSIDDESGMVVEYWESDRRVYHVWCAACGWAGDVVTVERLIGHEPEH